MNTQGTQNQEVTVNLIDVLKKETKTLKVQYIALMKEFSKEEFKKYSDLSNLDQFDLGKTIGFDSYMRTRNVCSVLYPKGIKCFSDIDGLYFWNHKASRKLEALQSKVRNSVKLGEEGYIAKNEILALDHYESSISKLALRIESKGLNKNNLKVSTSHIDVNIETTLTDGIKTVRAFTIIASGEVQKPHYRYLIK